MAEVMTVKVDVAGMAKVKIACRIMKKWRWLHGKKR